MIAELGAKLAQLRDWRDGRTRRVINRHPSQLLARGAPWASIMLGSLIPALAWIASAPILPAFGLLVLIAWRQLRPGLLPVWAGLPLGAFDDLYSGQPFGSAILLWSSIMLLLEALEVRFPWRGFLLEWLIAALLIAAVMLLGVAIANLVSAGTPLGVAGPQIAVAILCYPLVARGVAALDRLRLVPLFESDS